MHNQGELSRHCQTTYRRIAPRRSAVTAVADVFIQSLVLAGFCPDHAPKRRTSPVQHKFTSTGYRTFSTSTKHNLDIQSANTPNFGLPNRPFNPRIPHIHSQPLSAYAAKSELDDRDGHHVSHLSSKRTNDKISTITERVLDDLPLGNADRGTISPSNVPTRGKQERRTNITPPRPVLRLTTFRGHHFWVIDYNRWLKTTRRRNNKDGPAVQGRWQVPKLIIDLKLLLPAIEDRTKSNQYIFSLYKRLPSPGVNRLSVEERAQLLYRFAHPPDRRRSNARYFLSLFNDMIDAGFKVSKSLCTSAIYFTAHKVPRLEKRDLMDAIAIWHRMETIYGLESDSVVFELLFRIATLSGHFAVGDRLYQEMKNRGMSLSRRGHVTMLYSYGIRGDVEGIHKSFEEFVSTGEVVDTTVLNCLISSLLNAGDLTTAQQVYSRMLRSSPKSIATAAKEHPQAVLLPSTSTDFAARRLRAQNLCMVFETYLERKQMQNNALVPELFIPIVPNIRTFAIILRHHCFFTGDLIAISQLLNDMEKFFENPPRVIIYYFLFRGFGTHSSTKGWTEELLLGVWGAFKRVLYDSYERMNDSESLWLHSKPAGIWENPLKSFNIYQLGSHTHSLELADDQSRESNMSKKYENDMVDEDKQFGDSTEETATDEGKGFGGDVAGEASENEDLMTLFDQLTQYGRLQEEWFPDENMRRRLENGMFLGRELNIVILKAFGAHCDAKTLLRVYADIERMWRPSKRLAVDVNSVRKELQRQLVRAQKREREKL
ncbi:hypothetical protein EYB26_001161 [Talaromyces marneffei]|uniref:uncharacterized protein n=1 Tax=Talaromyces marneffei TaxID=37727 RepID=UPI0012A83CA4|nr:uncharacterized protein EYB26_001161 [Talaromyces marneffei]QGA13511.1 hypothetical protein EYB26_001161 [Talaromyces marneffei]